MRYGVIVVPFGREWMLFRKKAPLGVATVDDPAGFSNCGDGDWADDDNDDEEEMAKDWEDGETDQDRSWYVKREGDDGDDGEDSGKRAGRGPGEVQSWAEGVENIGRLPESRFV